MNLKEFERSLSNFSAGYETYIKLMSDIKRLDNLIQANEKQLNDSLIKIPFTHLYFVVKSLSIITVGSHKGLFISWISISLKLEIMIHLGFPKFQE